MCSSKERTVSCQEGGKRGVFPAGCKLYSSNCPKWAENKTLGVKCEGWPLYPTLCPQTEGQIPFLESKFFCNKFMIRGIDCVTNLLLHLLHNCLEYPMQLFCRHLKIDLEMDMPWNTRWNITWGRRGVSSAILPITVGELRAKSTCHFEKCLKFQS